MHMHQIKGLFIVPGRLGMGRCQGSDSEFRQLLGNSKYVNYMYMVPVSILIKINFTCTCRIFIFSVTCKIRYSMQETYI